MTPSRTKAKIPVPLKFHEKGLWTIALRGRPFKCARVIPGRASTSRNEPHFLSRSDAVKWQKAQRKKEGK